MTQSELARGLATALSNQDPIVTGTYSATDVPLPVELVIVSQEVLNSWENGTPKQQADRMFALHLAEAAFQLLPVE